MKKIISIVLALLLLPSPDLYAQNVRSLSNPMSALMELGVGVIGVDVPQYPGSHGRQTRILPFPALIYRGRVVRADEDGGLRGRFFKNDTFELNISFNWNFSAESSEIPIREGMPDLDDLFELGPSLIWQIKQASKESPWKLAFSLPIRFAITTDFKSLQSRGWVLNPFFFFIHERFIWSRTLLMAGLDTRWATRSYQDYYFTVSPPFATPDRPAFQAQGGYLSSTATLGLGHTLFKDFTFFYGLNYTSYQQSKNQGSPLLEREGTWSYALGFIWWVFESKTRQNAQNFF